MADYSETVAVGEPTPVGTRWCSRPMRRPPPVPSHTRCAVAQRRRNTSTVSSRPRSCARAQGLDRAQALGMGAVAALARMTIGSFGRDLLAQLLQPLGDVHRVADQGVVEPVAGADIADQGRAGVQADPQAQGREASIVPAGRGSSSAARTARAAWSGCGTGAPQKAIIPSPRNLSTVPSVSPTQPASSSKCWLSRLGGLRRVQLLGSREKPDDVGEQDRHLDLPRGDHVGRGVGHQLAAPAGAGRRSRTRPGRCASR